MNAEHIEKLLEDAKKLAPANDLHAQHHVNRVIDHVISIIQMAAQVEFIDEAELFRMTLARALVMLKKLPSLESIKGAQHDLNCTIGYIQDTLELTTNRRQRAAEKASGVQTQADATKASFPEAVRNCPNCHGGGCYICDPAGETR